MCGIVYEHIDRIIGVVQNLVYIKIHVNTVLAVTGDGHVNRESRHFAIKRIGTGVINQQVIEIIRLGAVDPSLVDLKAIARSPRPIHILLCTERVVTVKGCWVESVEVFGQSEPHADAVVASGRDFKIEGQGIFFRIDQYHIGELLTTSTVANQLEL